MTGTIYGYIRVSAREQNGDRRRLALAVLPVPEGNIYTDRQSSRDFRCPQHRQLVRRLRRDDPLRVKSIDRLGCNYSEILEQWRMLAKEEGVGVAVLDIPPLGTQRGKDLMGIFLSNIVLRVFSFMTESEYDSVRQWQAENIAAVRARGVCFGRSPLPLPDNFHMFHQAWWDQKITLRQAVRACGMFTGTFYSKAIKLETPNQTNGSISGSLKTCISLKI